MPILHMPVGVRVLQSFEERFEVPVYRGVAYCDAVRRAGEGEMLRVLPGSIQVCRWAPVVLGLKQPRGRFESNLSPRLSFPVSGLLLAPLERFHLVGEPDVVVVRASPEALREMIDRGGRDRVWDGHEGRLDRSALTLFGDGQAAQRPGPRLLRRGLIGAVNRPLAALARFAQFQSLTHWLFRSGLVTASFDALISRTLADMSVCRNSTVVPLLSGRVNVSFFCTGGITWGCNQAGYLSSGWPWSDFQRIQHVEP